MKIIRYILINGSFVVLMYIAFVMKIPSVENILLFFTWIAIIMSPFLLDENVIKKIHKEGKSVPRWLDVSYDICYASVFVAYDHWITGSFWILHMFICIAVFEKVKNYKCEDKNEKSN